MPRKRAVLTAKQKRFAENYVTCRVIYKAAVDAGYSHSFANTGAGKMLDNPAIQDYMDRLLTKMDIASIATQEEILTGLTRVFRRQETDDVVSVVKVPTVVEYTDKNGETKEKTAYREEQKIVQVRNNVADQIKAGTELMKVISHTTQSKMEIAKLKKLQAEVKLAENKLENGDSSEVTINITPVE